MSIPFERFPKIKVAQKFGSRLQLLRRYGDVKDDRWVARKVVDVAGGRVDEQDLAIRPDPVTCGRVFWLKLDLDLDF